LSTKTENEVKSIRKLKKRLRKEGYSEEAIREICRWYE
jgi:microsomal dipeptidase-like Zn-dependent dipeptidase